MGKHPNKEVSGIGLQRQFRIVFFVQEVLGKLLCFILLTHSGGLRNAFAKRIIIIEVPDDTFPIFCVFEPLEECIFVSHGYSNDVTFGVSQA
ncbi:MAG: hypothetical protein VB010_03385 [Sphaerochaeta associata]|uniref:hypothetical protein n=1 Tax=Sphaerochaeta associata TaxID=1129264 RepID=UPI002B203F4A|nr:hypothetical protein [Sphaerochaeta associata]MEA5106383.1 hypothetical protein [Sphaerochaeta associata]